MKVKRLAALLLVGTLFLTQSISAHAQMPPNAFQDAKGDMFISPLWANVNDIQLDIYFDSGEACCAGIIGALSGTTKISAVFKLERKTVSGWSLERSWVQSSSTNSLSFFGTDAVSSGYTYRLSVTADVTRNSMTETVSTFVEGSY